MEKSHQNEHARHCPPYTTITANDIIEIQIQVTCNESRTKKYSQSSAETRWRSQSVCLRKSLCRAVRGASRREGRLTPTAKASLEENRQSQLQLISHLSNQTQSEPKEQNDNPWLAIAGSLVDDPFFEDYIAEIDRYRQELDAQAESSAA
jgi:hypothetical protein